MDDITLIAGHLQKMMYTVVGGHYRNNCYTNDTVLIRSHLQKMIDTVVEKSDTVGLSLNNWKTTSFILLE